MPDLKLTSFDIIAYRGLRHLRFNGLQRFNLLFGPNNSGKTSVLEAVGIYCRPADAAHWLELRQLRDPGGIDESRLVSLRWFFADLQPIAEQGQGDAHEPFFEGHISLQADGSHPLKQMEGHYQESIVEVTEEQRRRLPGRYRTRGPQDGGPLFQRAAEIEIRFHSKSGDGLHSMSFFEQEPFRGGQRVRGPSIPVIAFNSSTFHAGQRLVRLLHQLQFGPWHDIAVQAMQEFDRNIEGLEIGSSSGFRPGIYVRHRQMGVVPLSAFGDGMRRAVTLLVGAVAAENGVLLLDEIEAGIHYSALPAILRMLLKAAEQFQVQIFATTHSLDAIDAILAAETQLDVITAYRLPARDSTQMLAAFPGPALYELRYDGGKEVR